MLCERMRGREERKEVCVVCLCDLSYCSILVALAVGSRGDTQPDSQPVQSWQSSAEPQS